MSNEQENKRTWEDLKKENEFLKDILENMELKKKIHKIEKELSKEQEELKEEQQKEKTILHG